MSIENLKPQMPIYIYIFIEIRIALAPPFPGIRRFKEGRNFKQWTGDDSKALMKVNCVMLHILR